MILRVGRVARIGALAPVFSSVEVEAQGKGSRFVLVGGRGANGLAAGDGAGSEEGEGGAFTFIA